MKIASKDSSLKIDQNALDQELIRQVDLFRSAAEDYALAVSDRDKAKAKLEQVKAAAYFDVVDDADKKPSEANIAAAVLLSKKVVSAADDFLLAKEWSDKCEAVKESVGQRGYVLKDLCALYVAGYFGTTSVGGRAGRNVQEQAYGANRAGMAKQRRAKL